MIYQERQRERERERVCVCGGGGGIRFSSLFIEENTLALNLTENQQEQH